MVRGRDGAFRGLRRRSSRSPGLTGLRRSRIPFRFMPAPCRCRATVRTRPGLRGASGSRTPSPSSRSTSRSARMAISSPDLPPVMIHDSPGRDVTRKGTPSATRSRCLGSSSRARSERSAQAALQSPAARGTADRDPDEGRRLRTRARACRADSRQTTPPRHDGGDLGDHHQAGRVVVRQVGRASVPEARLCLAHPRGGDAGRQAETVRSRGPERRGTLASGGGGRRGLIGRSLCGNVDIARYPTLSFTDSRLLSGLSSQIVGRPVDLS
jgi:hypothetical protein